MRFRRVPKCKTTSSHRFVLFFGALLLVILEESHWGIGGNYLGNYYTSRVYRQNSIGPPRTNRTIERRSVGVIVVVNDRRLLEDEYQLAEHTLRSYCLYHDYPLFVIDFSENATSKRMCPQEDFMFRRHCAVAQFLRHNSSVDYLLFVDADIGVINPGHLIEEYIRPEADMIFYERIFNHEIMAGSYIARRSNFTAEFLESWANTFYRIPSNSFHGSDNGALHAVFLEKFCLDCSPNRAAMCKRIWEQSEDYEGLSRFTSCIRSVLGDRSVFEVEGQQEGRVLLLIASTSDNNSGTPLPWARDGWLTGNQWSEGDFMLHGWQKRRMDHVVFARWHSPLVLEEAMAVDNWKICGEGKKNCFLAWPYKDSFIKPTSFIRRLLWQIALESRKRHLYNLVNIQGRIGNV